MTTVKRTMHVLDKTGDTQYAWDVTNPAEVEKVRAKFNEIVKGLKFLAYTVPADGSTGTAIREFDPEIEGSIVLTPQMQGG